MVCGNFAGIFLGPAFVLLKVAKQLNHVMEPLPAYGSARQSALLYLVEELRMAGS